MHSIYLTHFAAIVRPLNRNVGINTPDLIEFLGDLWKAIVNDYYVDNRRFYSVKVMDSWIYNNQLPLNHG